MTNRPLRPLAIFALLAFGDYLLWNWSLSGNRDILALASGLTLMPLLIAIVWLVVVLGAQLLADFAQRPRAGQRKSAGARSAHGHGGAKSAAGRAAHAASTATREQLAAGASGAESPSSASSSKLAA